MTLCVRREFEAGAINKIINDPAVFTLVALPSQTEIDMTEILKDTNNVLLMVDGGGLFFHWQEPGVYEVHTQFLPEVRGAFALRATRDAITWMFLHTDCMELQTKVPECNPGAEFWAKAIGGVFEFRRDAAWEVPGGLVGVKYYVLRHSDWFRSAKWLEGKGIGFHKRLEDEYKRLGHEHKSHDDDSAHNRNVGMACETILAGQVIKGVVLYNKWARFAGYSQMAIVALEPRIINIGEALLLATGDTFEVLKCL